MKIEQRIEKYLNEKKIKIPDYSELGLKASKFDVTQTDMARATTVGAMTYLMPEFTKRNVAPLAGTNKFDLVMVRDNINIKWSPAGKRTLKVRMEQDPSYFNDVLKVFKMAYKNYFKNLKKL